MLASAAGRSESAGSQLSIAQLPPIKLESMLKGGGEKVFDTVTSGEGEGGKMHVWDG